MKTKQELKPITNEIGVYDWIKDLFDKYSRVYNITFSDIGDESEWDYQINVVYTNNGGYSSSEATIGVINLGEMARIKVDDTDKFCNAMLMIARAIERNPRDVQFNHKEKTIKLFDRWELHKWTQYRFVDDFTDKYKDIYNLYKSEDLKVIGDKQ